MNPGMLSPSGKEERDALLRLAVGAGDEAATPLTPCCTILP